MTRWPRTWALAVVLAVAVFVAAGCGESTDDAEQALCADLATLQTSAAMLAESSSDTSVDDFEQARQNVREAWADVKSSADNLGDDRFDDVEDAWSDVADAFDDVDDADSLEQVRADVATEFEAFRSSASELGSGIDCADDETD